VGKGKNLDLALETTEFIQFIQFLKFGQIQAEWSTHTINISSVSASALPNISTVSKSKERTTSTEKENNVHLLLPHHFSSVLFF
jgi:hypothetical protein